jgi:hypothetical protein
VEDDAAIVQLLWTTFYKFGVLCQNVFNTPYVRMKSKHSSVTVMLQLDGKLEMAARYLFTRLCDNTLLHELQWMEVTATRSYTMSEMTNHFSSQCSPSTESTSGTQS